jgi:hypothetical protein
MKALALLAAIAVLLLSVSCAPIPQNNAAPATSAPAIPATSAPVTLAFAEPVIQSNAAPTSPPGQVASPPETRVSVDNTDASFWPEGNWYYTNGDPQYGADCFAALPGLDATAEVRPELPQSGAYEVFATWCGGWFNDQAVERLSSTAWGRRSHPRMRTETDC